MGVTLTHLQVQLQKPDLPYGTTNPLYLTFSAEDEADGEEVTQEVFESLKDIAYPELDGFWYQISDNLQMRYRNVSPTIEVRECHQENGRFGVALAITRVPAILLELGQIDIGEFCKLEAEINASLPISGINKSTKKLTEQYFAKSQVLRS